MPVPPPPNSPDPAPLPPSLPAGPLPPFPPRAAPRPLWRQSMDAHDDLQAGETRYARGIGGWLLLFTFGRVLAILFWAVALLKDASIFVRPGVWSALTTPGSSAYQPFWSKLIVYETTGHAFLLFGSIVLVCLLFARWRIFRPLMVSYMVLTPLFLWGDYWLAQPLQELNADALQQVLFGALQNTLFALIWIPYLLISERAKGTFYK